MTLPTLSRLSVVRTASLVVASALLSVDAGLAEECASPVVQTTGGRVCGTPTVGGPSGWTKRPIQAYLGIPFAAPPTGERRWAAPVAPVEWIGVRDATKFGPSCPQPVPDGVEIATSEDCLSVNVWTPNQTGSLPVMVFLGGGSFTRGGAAAPVYDGANLAGAGRVVVVTVNSRMGALGYLAGSEPFEGNYGILDQQRALRWVRDNIAAFGGDSTRVTLFGQGAGAMAVGIHLAATSSRELFRAAILQSNPYGVPYKTPEQAEHYAGALARALECPEGSGRRECLVQKSAAQIVGAQEKVSATEGFLLGLTAFAPWAPVVGAAPIDRQPNEAGIDKPVIIGTNENEGALFVGRLERATGTVDDAAYVRETDIAFGDKGSAVRTFYDAPLEPNPTASPGDAPAETPVPRDDTFAGKLSEIVSDDVFTCANRFVSLRAGAPVFAYQFVHAPSFSIWPTVPACAPATGLVCHGAELPFVFGNSYPPGFGAAEASFTEPEQGLSRTVQHVWAGFAADLVPPETSPMWEPFTKEVPFHLLLAEPSRSSLDLRARCRYWDALGYDRTGPLGVLF